MYTGLQVAKDLGQRRVACCILMVIGSPWPSSCPPACVVRLARAGRPHRGRPRGRCEPEPDRFEKKFEKILTDVKRWTMSNVILFNLTTVLFGVASASTSAPYMRRTEDRRFGTWVCMLAAVVSTAAWESDGTNRTDGDRPHPVTNLYESLVFFAWSVNLFYLIVEWKYANRTFGAFVCRSPSHDGLRRL